MSLRFTYPENFTGKECVLLRFAWVVGVNYFIDHKLSMKHAHLLSKPSSKQTQMYEATSVH
jgi:hypothetical protein